MVGCPRMPRVAAAVLVLLSLASAEVVQPQTCPGGVCPGVVPIDAVRGGFATDYGPVVANVVGTFKAKFGEDPTMVGVAPGHPPSLTANSPSYILVTRSDGRALQPPAQSLGIAAKGCGGPGSTDPGMAEQQVGRGHGNMGNAGMVERVSAGWDLLGFARSDLLVARRQL